MRFTTLLAGSVALAVGASVLSGCGGDDSPTRPGSGGPKDPPQYQAGWLVGSGGFADGIAVDSEGAVYVLDDDQIYRYDSNGTLLGSWQADHDGERAVDIKVVQMSVSQELIDYVIVLVQYRQFPEDRVRLRYFWPAGTEGYQAELGGDCAGQRFWIHEPYTYVYCYSQVLRFGGSASIQWDAPTDLTDFAVSRDGTQMYFVRTTILQDPQAKVVFVTTAAGASVRQWGVAGLGDGQFQSPEGITVDRDGNLYISDSALRRVSKFTPEGGFLYSFGSDVSEFPNVFDHPEDLAVGEDLSVYVLNRVTMAGEPYSWVTKFGY